MSQSKSSPGGMSPLGQALLAPRSVALVGASGDPKKNTARPLRFMRKHGYDGQVYPINPRSPEVFGEQAWPGLAGLPAPVDHVFVMIPGEHVLGTLEQCAAAGAKVVTIYSDGFAESGAQGRERQDALVARARELGLRLLGPNSIGTANLRSGGVISVNAAFEADDLTEGDIALVSQSGSMMGSLISRAAARGFGFSKSVSVGNECDITVGEVVDELVDDDETKVILLFMETLRDAPRLAAALDRARAVAKPVICYKLGRSAQGDALAQSHTGAMAGNDAAVDAFLRAHGVMRVHLLETLIEMVPLARRYIGAVQARGAALDAAGRARGDSDAAAPRVAVITTTGGGAGTVVDNLGLRGLVAAAPPPYFVEHMARRGLRIRETPVIDLTLAANSQQYQDLLEQLLQCDWCDAVLSVAGSSAQFHPDYVVQPLVQAKKSADKPLAAFLAPEAAQSLALLQQHGIAAFRTPEACADALSVLFAHGEYGEYGGHGGQPAGAHGSGAPATAGAATAAASAAPEWPTGLPRTGALTEFEAGVLFRALGVPVARAALVPADAPEHDIPYPVVVKVASRDVPHKTDVGGVRTGVADPVALREAARDIVANVGRQRPEAHIDGVLVQQMEGRLLELILGYRDDPLVGPIVVLGAGGIAAELNPDIAIRPAPVDEAQAHRMIEQVRITRLVRGYRGLPRGDCDALARAVAAFSRLAVLRGVRVAEAEINPLFVQEQGVVAVDGLVHLASKEQ
jgi:acyl-CoA synthetase (NDP forming)